MHLNKFIAVGLAIAALTVCSNRASSLILWNAVWNSTNAITSRRRKSMGIDKRLQDIFRQGYIEEGMTQEMVNLL